MKTAVELFKDYQGLSKMVSRPYRLFDIKEIADEMFVYFSHMENDKRAVEEAKATGRQDTPGLPTMADLLAKAASSNEMFEKTAPIRKFLNDNLFGKVLIKIDPAYFYDQNVFPKWWNGDPVAYCPDHNQELIADTFFNTYDLVNRASEQPRS